MPPIGVCLQRSGPDAPPTPVVLLPFMRHGDLHRFLLRCRLGERPVVCGGGGREPGGIVGGNWGSWGGGVSWEANGGLMEAL